MAAKTGLLQGTLDLLILRALSLGPNHGLGVSRRVQQITRGAFDVRPGSLFPALHRLEEQGWLRSEWGESENRRRAKYVRAHQIGTQTSRSRDGQLGPGGGRHGVRDSRDVIAGWYNEQTVTSFQFPERHFHWQRAADN